MGSISPRPKAQNQKNYIYEGGEESAWNCRSSFRAFLRHDMADAFSEIRDAFSKINLAFSASRSRRYLYVHGRGWGGAVVMVVVVVDTCAWSRRGKLWWGTRVNLKGV